MRISRLLGIASIFLMSFVLFSCGSEDPAENTEPAKKAKLFVTPTTISFTYKGGTESISIESDGEWTVKCNQYWATISDKGGSGNGGFDVIAPENTTENVRKCIVTISLKDGSSSKAVEISQEGQEPKDDNEPTIDPKNLVKLLNADFNLPNAGWTQKNIKNSQYATVTWMDGGGVDDSGCIKIQLPAGYKGCVGMSQKLTGLEPNKMYRFRAMAKTSNIVDGRGAVIFDMSTRQWWNASKHLKGVNYWQEVFSDFYSNDKGEAEIVCALGYRLGGTSSGGYASGTVWYDNASVEKITDEYYCYYESDHFILYTDLGKADIENLKTKSRYLDKAYESMVELVGATPFSGKKIAVTGTYGLESGYWALAGNPILLGYDSNAGVVNNSSEITFGLIHEVGHNFNAGGNFENGQGFTSKWNWTDEIFANFRAFYGVMMSNSPCSFSGKNYVGADLKKFYEGKYNSTLKIGENPTGDAFTYIFIKIGDEMGWGDFAKGFQDIYKNGKGPFANNWEKFDYMITTFQKYTTKDLRTIIFPLGELDIIKSSLGGN